MTPEEIRKLAEEYAEEHTRKTYPNAPSLVRERIIEGRLEHMEDFIPWLLRTHCIVSKEKVRNHYNMAKSNIKTQYLEACQYEVGATEVLESIFDPDTFDETDK